MFCYEVIMKYPTIAFLDLIGLVYDGTTLSKRGLGGSESAVILISKELAKLGFNVTVFNACQEDDSIPGIYDGVTYRPITSLNQNDKFDIVISSRTVVPFVPDHYYDAYKNATRHHPSLFKTIRDNAKLKIMWMHDTFANGDLNLEDLVVNDYIDYIFTLSDFHTAYVTNCNHGKRRNFEVLKNKVFQTRNAVVQYIDEVDISKKDRDLFVYNASVTKGMLPLIDRIWPRIKQYIPQAKLKIVGGYYKFRDDSPLDAQGETLMKLVKEQKYKDLDIEFTGIITQKEIAELLAKANMFLFPGAFPETFGISTLESLTYNTPLVATRFGALEETAVDLASYFIDYAIEPNSLFTEINIDHQVEKFVEKVIRAYKDPYLHQQKQYYCNIIKDIHTWDTVALQWKQLFLKMFGQYMPVEEYRKVSYINSKVHKVYGRRFSNQVEWSGYKRSEEQSIAVITPFYNAKDYIVRCIESVASQDYESWSLYLIDDCSTDDTKKVIDDYVNTLPIHIRSKIIRLQNKTNMGAPCNQINTIRKFVEGDDTIVMLLDGDDALANNPNIFNYYNNLFADNKTDYAYGSCWSEADDIPLIAQPYPKSVREAKTYRNHKFNWGMPYPHLRVWKRKLLNNVLDNAFKDESGNWYKAGGDNATFYNILEQADPNKVVAVQEIFYVYNDKNPLNDYKVNGELQNKNASVIAGNKIVKEDKPVVQIKQSVESNIMKKRILIAIPTAKNIEPSTFKSIYDLEVPEGYETVFQYFYGYNVDQVRNLIADWVTKTPFDYLFSVDYDISFAPDTLKKLLSHDKDVVTGIYRQRIPDRQTLEVFESNDRGGYTHIPWDKIKGKGLVEIGACGFGCVLVKREVFAAIGYPQFVYKSAINHNDTFSEDLYFAKMASQKGFKMYADTSIICDHTGSYVFRVQ